MAEIIIDTYLCSGCGTCVALCPQVFGLDELSGKAELLDITAAITDDILQAASFCPEKCIEIRN